MGLLFYFNFMVRCNTIIKMRRQPLVLLLVQRCLRASLRRELLNDFINLLVCAFVMVQIFFAVVDA